ncbi:hypothetical protein HYDPIDRAFT_141388 [Hydnomerulius pinastri MD-312]|uniref:Uncharacterized protein n=1 Tax=Hydnomerulius pinastri MD-312 TaxID=994086 RepID=A0A0C9W842_9AGAM|nr:hypothetical protein HYDPIDRAFT_141388 [Hydnomerulius pinastri MD-312]
MQLVFEELQRMNLRVSGLEEVNQTLLPSQQQLTERVGGTEEAVIRIEALLAVSHENTTNKTGSSKNISNQHPHLKNVVHPMLFNLCGIDKATAGDQAELIEMLCSQGELPGTEAFMVAINGKVNGLFINEIVNRIYENETSLRNTPGSKPELDDADYKKSVIMSMAKSYFRNIADQVGKQSNQRKQERHLKKQIATRRRARRAAVAGRRRDAVAQFEADYQVQGVAAMVDTDFISDVLSYKESDLSDASRDRRKEQNLGKGAKMTVRLEWRSLDYVVFLRVLDSIQKRGNVSVAVPAAGSADATTATTTAVTGPPSKRRKVGKKDVHKNNFDTHPSKMSTRTPDSQKAIPTIPFRGMMNTAWLSANPSTTVLDGMTWLEDFHKRAKEGDLTPEDREYLEELATWIAEHADDEGGSAEAEVSGV